MVGPPIQLIIYRKNLAKNRCEVLVATTNANGKERLEIETNKIIPLEQNLNIKYYNETIIGRFSFQFLFNVWKDIKNSDLVHTQPIFSTVSLIAIIYSYLFKKHLVLSPRGSLGKWSMLKGKPYKYFWIYFLIKPFAGHINFHATSETEALDIQKHFPHSDIFVVPERRKFN